MELQTQVKFKKPYFIEQLGEEGLTARDVAESLGVTLQAVNRKLERKWYSGKVKDWQVKPYGFIEEINGLEIGKREIETYVLNTKAAKAFVARWNNSTADAYLDFLFNCETVVTEIVPKLKAELDNLKEQLEAAEKAYVSKHPKRLQASKKGKILAPVYINTLFGLQLDYEYKEMSELTKEQLDKARLLHSMKTIHGLTGTMIKQQEKVDENELKFKNKRIGEM